MKVTINENAKVLGSELQGMPGYRLVEKTPSRRTYKKWNPILGIGSYIEVDDDEKTIKVGKVQDVAAIIDRNKILQNNFDGYRNKLMVQTSNVPIVVDQMLKEKCGYNPHTGDYDREKYDKLLNDGDNKYLRTIPGKV